MGIFGAAKRGFGILGKKTPKKRSDFKLKNKLKRIQKTPDKNFKSSNPATEKGKTREGVVYEKRKTSL